MASATTRAADVIVVGAGVSGLTTALVLCERGLQVEVWSKDAPADTVSAVAGAIWYPFLAEPRERVLGWSATTFRRLQALAVLPSTGVHMQPVTQVFTTATPDLWWSSAVGAIEHLPAAQLSARHRAAIRLDVPVCAVPAYLPWLQAALHERGGRLVRRELRTFDEAFDVAKRVVNCSGLGARSLCSDVDMQPVRGQVVVVERCAGVEALIDDTGAQPFYVIPRGDEIVLGGTAQAGDDRLLPDPRDTTSIVDGIALRVPALRDAGIRRVTVGLRPYRRTVRLEAEVRGGGRLVHNYGHGGSGFTLAWGCAEEVASLLTG